MHTRRLQPLRLLTCHPPRCCSVADVGDAWVERCYGLPPPGVPPPPGAPPAEPHDSLRSPHDDITHFYNAVVAAGASPVTAGGVRALHARGAALIQAELTHARTHT